MACIGGWQWGNQGVDVYEHRLTWFEKEGPVRFAGGAACDQTLDDFLSKGPLVGDVPSGDETDCTTVCFVAASAGLSGIKTSL